MKNTAFAKIIAAVAVVATIGIGVTVFNGFFKAGFNDGGVDVSNTACEDIASARLAVNQELEQRRTAAQEALNAEREAASDAFWAENSRLEKAYHECEFAALSADPCKAPFEKIGDLYNQIMADFEAGNGFNEGKFQEREQAKKEYDECVKKQNKDEFYDEAKAKCDADLASGQKANQEVRTTAENVAVAKHDAEVIQANNAHKKKHEILDAIEEKCNEPADKVNVRVGAFASGQIYPNNAACTGIFEGNDPDLKKKLSVLESQLQKAQAAGLQDGLYGTDHLQQAVDEARQELKDSERTCVTDSDCGDPKAICCSTSQVGRVFCSDGVCAAEQVDCVAPEVCAGSPAECVNPSTGVQQQDGVYISRTISEAGPCSQNLQVLNLQKATPDSARYEITGNIPDWVNIDKPGGSLPASVNVAYSCNTVQSFGPGTYTADGSIQVYNSAGELINTIPFNISITVEPAGVEEKTISVIGYNDYYIPVDQLKRVVGDECDQEEHWHPAGSTVTNTKGMTMSDPNPTGCGFGKTSEVPVMDIPVDENMQVEIKGLEGLRSN